MHRIRKIIYQKKKKSNAKVNGGRGGWVGWQSEEAWSLLAPLLARDRSSPALWEWRWLGFIKVEADSSTVICLFNDYDLPLPRESFITGTPLGQGKRVLGSNPGQHPLGSHAMDHTHSAISNLKVLLGVSGMCLIFHRHLFCWMYFVLHHCCGVGHPRVQLSSKQNGCSCPAVSL